MFPEPLPHLFALPPGIDFGAEVVRGLQDRMRDAPPEAWADLTIVTNTRRMARRIAAALDDGTPRILPRLVPVAALGLDPILSALPLPGPALVERMELAQLIRPLVEAPDSPVPRAALFSLADSLAALMDEMDAESIPPGAVSALDVMDQSGHWQRMQAFLAIVADWRHQAGGPAGREARQRDAVANLALRLADGRRPGPLVVAGSTGSRGTTALLIRAVAQHPQGAVILPGVDRDQPPEAWAALTADGPAQDHPQYRYQKLCADLRLDPWSLPAWTDTPPPCPARNRLVSLALRPAPVTDRWREEGPELGDLTVATAGLTLIEAPTPRDEAEALAMGLRDAVARGVTAALISPDRDLTRAVTATLDRWGIVPDDSGGLPMAQSPPGRLLRQIASLMGRPADSQSVLSLLKHPLVVLGGDRGEHLRMTRELELWIRRKAIAFPDAEILAGFDVPGAAAWTTAVLTALTPLARLTARPLADWASAHLTAAQALGGADLWGRQAGRMARALLDEMIATDGMRLDLDAADYQSLTSTILTSQEVRERDVGDPRVLIWGTLEARVQSAGLVMLAGLNEGVWPPRPPPDPWLNRALRARLGLTPPERRIGLSAHDFQQAAAAPEVWLSRSVRSDDAPAVASRWLSRITSLIGGLEGDQQGPEALTAMRQRGAVWLARAAAQDRAQPTDVAPPAAPRPAPVPPLAVRPTRLRLTEITTLIRDPYAIYARHILRLEPLDPLTPQADARLRGILLHRLLQRFVEQPLDPNPDRAERRLLQILDDELGRACPWPALRLQWRGQIAKAARWFVLAEAERQAAARPAGLEVRGEWRAAQSGVTVRMTADRIDRLTDGRVVILDYKTRTAPSQKMQLLGLDRQVMIEAALAEVGGFSTLGPVEVARGEYLTILDRDVVPVPLDQISTARVRDELEALLFRFGPGLAGFTARKMMLHATDISDYDLLSRHGEWDVSQPATRIDLS
jgi:inactivated superfamily I helicase/RecB family exonuclease